MTVKFTKGDNGEAWEIPNSQWNDGQICTERDKTEEHSSVVLRTKRNCLGSSS